MKSFLLLSLLGVALPLCASKAEDVLDDVAKDEPSSPDGAASLWSNGQPPAPTVQGASRPNSNCPRGWHRYEDNCFLFMNLSYSWTNADSLCQSLGASLASAHNLLEDSFLKQLTWRAGFLSAWMGGYRFQGFWKWDDGTPFDYQNWYQNSHYECVHLNSQDTRGWSSSSCTSLHPFICSTPLNACKS